MPHRKARTADIEQRLLIDAIYHRYHYDFRGYAQASLKRRLASALVQFDCKTLSQLQDRVLHEPAVFPALLEYLTVQVSDMFRDPSYFQALRQEVVPLLRTYPSLKVWVAGCSAGEEVYSLAILLQEEGLLDRTLIYATDINPHALRAAERLHEDGWEIEVVDLRSVKPLDMDTVLASVARTGRLLAVGEAFPWGGVTAEVVARTVSEGFHLLDAPPQRLNARDTPVPYHPKLWAAHRPTPESIQQALRKLLNF